MKVIKIQINTKNHNYPIIIGSGLIAKISKLLNNNSIKFGKCLLVIDNKIPKKLINKIFKNYSDYSLNINKYLRVKKKLLKSLAT